MKQHIKLAIIGGTGKSGKYLVNTLLQQAFPIKLLLRNPDRFQIKNQLVDVVIGDVRDYNTIHTLVESCDAVISTLGLGIPSSEPSIFSQSTANVIKAMKHHHVKRYIVTTGLNVDTPFDKKGPNTASATEWMKSHFPLSTVDKQLEYDLLVNSTLDWTLVRFPLIEQTEERRETKVSLEDCPGEKISVIDLAHFLIHQLSDDSFIRKAPFIANI